MRMNRLRAAVMVAAFPDRDLGTPPVRQPPRTVSRLTQRSGTNEDVEPLQIVPATPPVEATLRIMMNSVPFLIGCAVVRQPAGPDVAGACVSRRK